MSSPPLPLYGPTAPSGDLSPASGAQVADRVLAGLGDGFRLLAGPLLPALVRAYAAPLQTTTDGLQIPAGPVAAAALAAGTTGGSDGPPIPALLDLLRSAHPEYLAQLAGVLVPIGATPAQVRALIATRSTARRGTLVALRAAIAATLTAPAQMVILERDEGDPYRIKLVTYTAQTPDPAATYAAALSEKPVGLVLVHEIANGQDYSVTTAEGKTYAQHSATGRTYTGRSMVIGA